jgi:hypothetical protein
VHGDYDTLVKSVFVSCLFPLLLLFVPSGSAKLQYKAE